MQANANKADKAAQVGFIAIGIIAVMLSGCDLGGINKSRNRISLPSFAVEPFEYTDVQTPTPLYADDFDCLTELSKSSDAGKELSKALNEEDNAKPLALAMSTEVYANLIFYDCNIREQLVDDKPEEIEDTSDHVLYHAGKVGSKEGDKTRFISWRELKNSEGSVPKTDGEADNIVGVMTNLYTFDGGKDNQQTRVSLDKKESLRQIGAHTHVAISKDGEDSTFVWKGYVIEHKSGTNKEHLLGFRLLNYQDEEELILLLAHYKAEGASLLEAECEIDDNEDYNKSCANAKYKVSYYNAATDKIEDEVPAGFKKTRDDFLTNVATNWAHGSYFADRLDPASPFFAGTGSTDANMKEFFTADLPTQ